jgi:cell division protein FtsX
MQNNIALPYFAGLGSLGGLFGIIIVIATIVLHILFAVCIWNDASQRLQKNQPLIILTDFTWSLAALLLGLVAVAFYWLCHYSRFFKREP